MNTIRRTVVSALVALALLPGIGRSQRALRRIAWFGVGLPETVLPYLGALQAGLRESGWEEGRNLPIDRYTSTRPPQAFDPIVRTSSPPHPAPCATQKSPTLPIS